MKTFHSILVPVDGSPASLAALEQAIVIAQDYDAHVHMLQVTPARDPLSAETRDDIEDVVFAAAGRARHLLGPLFTVESIVGEPVHEIIAYAQDGFDLIVVGTRGGSGRMHALMGSVAESIVRNAPCPVLTVRDPAGSYQSFSDRRHRRPTFAEWPR